MKQNFSLVSEHGCAACQHRSGPNCHHPGLGRKPSDGVAVDAFVCASLKPGCQVVRPSWCPLFADIGGDEWPRDAARRIAGLEDAAKLSEQRLSSLETRILAWREQESPLLNEVNGVVRRLLEIEETLSAFAARWNGDD